jgi:hypothetical protein
MPNQVTSVNDFTLFKALKSLMRDDKMNFEQAQAAIERLREDGLLIREPAEKEEPKKVYRGNQGEPSLPETENKPAS